MKVIANRYLYRFREMLPEAVELDLFDPANLPDNVSEYDALFINTTTKLNSKTLPETGNLSFVATGSSGTDHMDLDYLKSEGIQTGDAAGCNAVTVAEYVLTAILSFLELDKTSIVDLKAGIIGEGHVGTEVSRLLTRFSIPHVSYDPPKSDRKPEFQSAHFEEIKECNLLTFHTPITYEGSYPTHHLLNRSWFRGTNYHLIINSSRGGVIDEDLILEELEIDRLKNAVIDVWENEPIFNPRVAKHSLFATPHIAGYSVQSKRRATQMIIRQFCEHADLQTPECKTEEPYIPGLKEDYSSLKEILLDLHPIGRFDKKMREMMHLGDARRGESFALLRSESTLRHEYSNIFISQHHLEKFPELKLLGVRPK